MDWYEIVVTIDNEIAEAAIGAFSEKGIDGLLIEDESILRDLSRDKKRWDYADDSLVSVEKGKTVLKGYVEQDNDIELLLEDLKNHLKKIVERSGRGEFEINLEAMENQDWNTEWKKYFKPIKIGKGIVIKPSWESIDEESSISSRDSIVIELDPGLAFGTGTHETTRMCLEFIEKYIKKGMKVYDVGCGSGILALAAAKLGASEVLGIDLDGDAVKAAKENVKINKEEEICKIVQGDLLSDLSGPADLLMANIIFDVILELLETAVPFVKKGGCFIISGILEEKTDQMIKAIKASKDFDLIEKKTDNGWSAMVLERRE